MIIYLIGYMGSGKSSVGKLLAAHMNAEFIDTDTCLTAYHQTSIAHIFAQYGEAVFRQLEMNTLQQIISVAKQSKDTCFIVATGGGLPCTDAAIAALLNSGKVVYLRALPATLSERLAQTPNNERPLLQAYDSEPALRAFVAQQLSIRKYFYKQAHFLVDTDSLSLTQTVAYLKKQLLVTP